MPEQRKPAERPPLHECRDVRRERSLEGHVWVYGDGWVYSCAGCGVEQDSPLAGLPCAKPYSDPVGEERLLIEIRDLLVEIRDILRQPRE